MDSVRQHLARYYAATRLYVADRFYARGLEWYLGTAMLVAGLELLLLGDTFSLSPYAFIRQIAGEDTWGSIFLLVGGMRLIALLFNGLLPHGTPHLRVLMALVSMLIWSELAIGYAVARIPSLMIAFVVPAALFEFVNVYRAARDASLEDTGGRA